MTFEAVVKKGHVGAGNHMESKIYVNAASLLEAMELAKNRGGVKKGRACFAGQSVLSIRAIKNYPCNQISMWIWWPAKAGFFVCGRKRI